MFDAKEKAKRLSDQYYNRGLDRAGIRDLSGAVDMLCRSLQFNKQNIQARNLLGLVYFEMGEAVSALSEWVISKNLQPEDNIASGFIDKLKANQNRLALINQTINSYNIALQNCKGGNEDVAAISLKKVISQNPRFIKAYHLLALIYISQGRYTRARKLLKKAIRIDRTNPTTLRYMKEIDEQTGSSTRLDDRKGLQTRSQEDMDAEMTAPGFRESSPIFGLFNIILGIAIGALAAWFLIAPSVRQSLSRQSNEKVIEYSNTMAVQKDQIAELQAQINEAGTDAEATQQEIADAQVSTEAYENLLRAYKAYSEDNYSEASAAFESVDSSLLSTEAKAIYDEMYDSVKDTLFRTLKDEGKSAFDYERWDEAIEKLSQAMEINDEDYHVLDYLAIAYRKTGNLEKSIEVFRKIVDQFPDTRRASSAQEYIDSMSRELREAGKPVPGDDGNSSDESAGDDEGSSQDDGGENDGEGDSENDGEDDHGDD